MGPPTSSRPAAARRPGISAAPLICGTSSGALTRPSRPEVGAPWDRRLLARRCLRPTQARHHVARPVGFFKWPSAQGRESLDRAIAHLCALGPHPSAPRPTIALSLGNLRHLQTFGAVKQSRAAVQYDCACLAPGPRRSALRTASFAAIGHHLAKTHPWTQQNRKQASQPGLSGRPWWGFFCFVRIPPTGWRARSRTRTNATPPWSCWWRAPSISARRPRSARAAS